MGKKLIFAIIFFLLCFQAQAIGIRSASLNRELYFEPNLEGEFFFNIIPYNPDRVDAEITVMDATSDETTSNIAQYFTLSRTYVSNIKIGESPSFSVKMKLPEIIEEPGTHKIFVSVKEISPNKGGGLSVTTGASGLIFIHVPYDGKYLRYSVVAKSANAGQPIEVIAHVSNIGNTKIEALYTEMNLMTLDNKTLATVKSETVSLESQESKNIHSNISTNTILPGTYKVKGNIIFDGESRAFEQEVKVGQLTFNILNQTKEIRKGKINEIEIIAQSQWADRIENVYAEFEIAGSKIIKTYSESFDGFEVKTLKGFFDATEIKSGVYDGNVRLHYGGERVIKDIKITVIDQSVLEYAKSSLTTSNVIFFIIIAMLFTINIILFMIVMNKKDEHEKQK